MLKYTLKTSERPPQKVTYEISNAKVNGDLFEFHFSKQHSLKSGDTIHIGESDSATINTRKKIVIGIGYSSNDSKFSVKWNYSDGVDINFDKTEWTLIGYIENNTIYDLPTTTIPNSMELHLKVEYGVLKAKPEHCSTYQDVIDIDTIKIPQFLSENSIIKVINVSDNYLTIPSFDINENIPYSNSYWDYEESRFVFRIERKPILDNTKDKLNVSLVYDKDSMEDFTTYPVDELFSFNPSSLQPNPDNLYNTPTGGEYFPPMEEKIYNVLDYEVIDECSDTYLINIKKIEADLTFKPENINTINRIADIKELELWIENTNHKIQIGITNNFDIKTNQEDLIKTKFYEVEKEKAINGIVDMERVQFTPVYPEYDSNGKIKRDKNNNIIFTTIRELEFNFFFLSDDKTYWGGNATYLNSNNAVPQVPTYWKDLGFVNDDVKYQKNKLKKTFFRLSYFDEKNPTKQNLLYTNTVFTNTSSMYSSYIKATKETWEVKTENGEKFVVDDDYFRGIIGTESLKPYFNTKFNILHPLLRDGKDGNNSSEGYYLYLTKDKAPEIHPVMCYIKIEFNNALNGKRSLFFNRFDGSYYQQGENTSLTADGISMDNIFFSQIIKIDGREVKSEDFVYLKVYLSYDVINGRYIYFPANTWCGNTELPQDLNYSEERNDSNCKNDYESYGGTASDMSIVTKDKKLVVNIYEGKVK